MKIFRILIVFLAIAIVCNSTARANTNVITEEQPITFGKFAMKDNAGQYSVIMKVDGTEIYDPRIFPFYQGTFASFQLTDFPPDTELFFSIPDTTVTAVADPLDIFDLINFTFSPSPAVTNGTGNLTLRVGATLRTSGNGILYSDSSYTGTYVLTIDY